MSQQPMETETHDRLKDIPTAGEGEDESMANLSNPVRQQEGSCRRVDTMSSVSSHIDLKHEAPIDEEHEELEHHDCRGAGYD